MLSDAMNAGVNPGGLQSRTAIRVLVCYILSNCKLPVPLEYVKEKLHFEGISNYFETAFAISELLENNNIVVVGEENGKQLFTVSTEGKKISDALSTDVPFSIRERSLEITEEIINKRKNEQENKVTKEKTKNGVYVTCTVYEKDLELVSVKILVPDNEIADKVRDNFLKNPMQTLISATNSLTGNKI